MAALLPAPAAGWRFVVVCPVVVVVGAAAAAHGAKTPDCNSESAVHHYPVAEAGSWAPQVAGAAAVSWGHAAAAAPGAQRLPTAEAH
eukprot:1140731-Pelagomonas_calceolata.AAC.8